MPADRQLSVLSYPDETGPNHLPRKDGILGLGEKSKPEILNRVNATASSSSDIVIPRVCSQHRR